MAIRDRLDREMVDAGEALIKRLTERGETIPAAFWMYLEEPEEWRLFIATPRVESQGPRETYLFVLSVSKEFEDELTFLTLQDISVVAPDDRKVKPFRQAAKLHDIAGYRFTRSLVNGEYVDDAYVYQAA